MVAPWWNSSFKIRRELTVPASTFTTDAHLLVQLGDGFVDSFKARTDLQDIEVVYWDGATQNVVASLAEIQSNEEEDFLNVQFARHTNQTTASTNYYLYMTNQSLRGINYLRPILPVAQGFYIKPGIPNAYYTSQLDTISDTPIPTYPGPYGSSIYYAQEAIPGDSSRFTVTRPTEDWVDGVSSKQNAAAAFIYSGGGCALRYESGPDRGTLKIVTNGITTFLDTYSNSYQYQLYYFEDDISSEYGFTHSFFVTGDKSPSSSGTSIKLDRMLYTHYDLAELGSEELFDGGDIRRYVIGV
jgi:hypothetical protein